MSTTVRTGDHARQDVEIPTFWPAMTPTNFTRSTACPTCVAKIADPKKSALPNPLNPTALLLKAKTVGTLHQKKPNADSAEIPNTLLDSCALLIGSVQIKHRQYTF